MLIVFACHSPLHADPVNVIKMVQNRYEAAKVGLGCYNLPINAEKFSIRGLPINYLPTYFL